MTFEVIDLFCGAGGTSTGILKAIHERMGKRAKLTAVNHWKTAVNTHSLNHPEVKHICETVENLHPLDLVKSGRLDLLAASCECRFHSNARGGGPCNEQSRSQPWQLIRWATDIHVENIMMENVREFMNWGPLHARTKRPIKSKKSQYFKGFVNALINLGYRVEFKVQVCANFGDPTSRPRLMLMARKGKEVIWPELTHGPGRAKPWNSARGIIDWKLKGKSIFNADGSFRHCRNTMKRIAGGLRTLGGKAAEPYLILLRGTSDAQIDNSARSIDDPVPTLTAGGRHVMLCEPFISAYHNGRGGESRNYSVDNPLPTQDTSNRFALVEPIIVQFDQAGANGGYARPIDRPLATVVTKQNMLLVQPMVLKYYKTGRCKPVDEPLDTVTTKPRFMLVEPTASAPGLALDILTRMLQPHELARAHSFPSDYRFTGNKEDQTKQIGNSVPVELAAAHAEAILS